MEDNGQLTKEAIDKIPVYYCAGCLSLHVLRGISDEIPAFCGKCYSANILNTDIHTWRELYHERYGIYFEDEK